MHTQTILVAGTMLVLSLILMIRCVFIRDGCVLTDIMRSQKTEQITVTIISILLFICAVDMVLLEGCRRRTREICRKDARMNDYRGLTEYESTTITKNMSRHKATITKSNTKTKITSVSQKCN